MPILNKDKVVLDTNELDLINEISNRLNEINYNYNSVFKNHIKKINNLAVDCGFINEDYIDRLLKIECNVNVLHFDLESINTKLMSRKFK